MKHVIWKNWAVFPLEENDIRREIPQWFTGKKGRQYSLHKIIMKKPWKRTSHTCVVYKEISSPPEKEAKAA